MKELDLLLVRWLERDWASAGPVERRAFEQLLDLPDPELAAYLLGHAQPPPELRPLVERLCTH